MITKPLSGSCALTQQEVADLLGVTRSAVSQVEQRALRKLKQAFLADAELCDLARDVIGDLAVENCR